MGCSVLLESGCLFMINPCSPACPSCVNKDYDVRSFLSSPFAASTFLEVGNDHTDISLEVGLSLQRLESLSISGRKVKLSIKVPLRLTSLQALARSELSLRFSHYGYAASMAETLQAYNFKCKEGLDESRMRPLSDALSGLGKHHEDMYRVRLRRLPSRSIRTKMTARKNIRPSLSPDSDFDSTPPPQYGIGWVSSIAPDEMLSSAYTAAVNEHLAAHAGSAGATAAMSFAQLHNPVCRFSKCR